MFIHNRNHTQKFLQFIKNSETVQCGSALDIPNDATALQIYTLRKNYYRKRGIKRVTKMLHYFCNHSH